MFKEHPAFRPPATKDSKIWRYRPLSRFEASLDGSYLWFARADQFKDAFEGTFPKGNKQQEFRRKQAEKARQNLKEQLEDLKESGFYDVGTIDIEEELNEEVEKIMDGPILAKGDFSEQSYFINCWHINEYESNLMWDSYVNGEGVAIQSTYNRFREALSKYEEDVFIGCVEYIDYSSNTIPENNDFYRYLHKRGHFQHESELRAITLELPYTGEVVEAEHGPAHELNWETQPSGLRVDVDIHKLIEQIYIGPQAGNETRKQVEEICRRNGLDSDIIIESDLNNSPEQ